MGDMSMSNDEVTRWSVLVVDDEPDNIGVVEKLLTFYGATVQTAYHGEEGLRLLQDMTPTFILLDLSMPTMDGWEMLAAVKSDPTRAHIPVIALTAHAMPEDVERVKAAGFDGYIPKPLRIATFLLEIQTCLESHAKRALEQSQETTVIGPKSGNGEAQSTAQKQDTAETGQETAPSTAAQETAKAEKQNELQSVDSTRR
jgi:CheY-like chemotaxis protein